MCALLHAQEHGLGQEVTLGPSGNSPMHMRAPCSQIYMQTPTHTFTHTQLYMVYVYTQMYIHTHVHTVTPMTYPNMHSYAHPCLHTAHRVCVSKHRYSQTHNHRHTEACVRASVHGYTHAQSHIYTLICIYTHAYVFMIHIYKLTHAYLCQTRRYT